MQLMIRVLDITGRAFIIDLDHDGEDCDWFYIDELGKPAREACETDFHPINLQGCVVPRALYHRQIFDSLHVAHRFAARTTLEYLIGFYEGNITTLRQRDYLDVEAQGELELYQGLVARYQHELRGYT
ncbi:MAG: hypothetical protein AABX72_01280 [Nanoarchaeota archaeon]|mgnify:FL=1